MQPAFVKRLIAIVAMLVAVAACDRQSPGAAGADGDATAPSAAEAVPRVELVDVMEATSDYVIGISYPQSVAKYPKLAAELKRYGDDASADLLQAVQARRRQQPSGEGSEGATMYDLSLTFTEIVDGPELVAYAADGSTYTGGAHGIPLLARFVWLPRQEQLLTAGALVPQASGWKDIGRHIREQLHTALSQRIEADKLSPADRVELVEVAGQVIDDGTEVDPGNFSQFEPVVGADGRLTGLRFVFVPYQVGPYSDGVQTVEVPASVLLPHVAPEYRGLFTGDSSMKKPPGLLQAASVSSSAD